MKRDRQSVFWKIAVFLVFPQLYFKRTLSHLFYKIHWEYSTNSCFTNTLEATTCVFLILAILKAVENLLRYINFCWSPFGSIFIAIGIRDTAIRDTTYSSISGFPLQVLKNTSGEGVHLIVKLPAISLQTCKFTKNELHTYFSRILARF